MRSKVLFCDEPTGNLDSTNSKMISDLLMFLTNQALLIIVTHDEDLADRCDQKLDSLMEKFNECCFMSLKIFFELKSGQLLYVSFLNFSCWNSCIYHFVYRQAGSLLDSRVSSIFRRRLKI